MSIAGYLSRPGNTDLRMPRSGQAGDAPLIQSEGAVMTGKKSVSAAREDVAIRAAPPGHESYKSVADYDPILRAHCRLEPHKTQF
jgi:hypothetical protein